MVAGLCDQCKHVQIVDSTKGSRFFLCMYTKIDARYTKYPRLPVMACRAYEEKNEEEKNQNISDQSTQTAPAFAGSKFGGHFVAAV